MPKIASLHVELEVAVGSAEIPTLHEWVYSVTQTCAK